MEKIIHKMNTLWGAAVALFTSTIGEFWYLFIAFMALNIVDYITGIIKAKFTHTENSNKGLIGIIKKVGYWIVIVIAFFVSLSFKKIGVKLGIDLAFMEIMGWFTLATFIINETRSILENLIIIGVDIPQFLINGLEVADKLIDKNIDK